MHMILLRALGDCHPVGGDLSRGWSCIRISDHHELWINHEITLKIHSYSNAPIWR